MYVDIKYTVWDRVQVNHKERAKLLNIAQRGNIQSPDDIYEALTDPETNYMAETAEFIPPDENKDQSTIEIHNEEGASLWTNAPAEKDDGSDVRQFMQSVRNHMDLTTDEDNLLHQLAYDLYNKGLQK